MDSQYVTLLGHRYSCRKFGEAQLTDDELSVILEAARKSPSARNNQPTRLCVVQGEEGLAKIDECTKCRYGAPTCIIVAYDYETSSHPQAPMGPETCDFGDIDASIAMTNMDNAAASLGLGGCWVGASTTKPFASASTFPRRTSSSSCSWSATPLPNRARSTPTATLSRTS